MNFFILNKAIVNEGEKIITKKKTCPSIFPSIFKSEYFKNLDNSYKECYIFIMNEIARETLRKDRLFYEFYSKDTNLRKIWEKSISEYVKMMVGLNFSTLKETSYDDTFYANISREIIAFAAEVMSNHYPSWLSESESHEVRKCINLLPSHVCDDSHQNIRDRIRKSLWPFDKGSMPKLYKRFEKSPMEKFIFMNAIIDEVVVQVYKKEQ